MKLLLLLLGVTVSCSCAAFSCMDMNNKPVDWFIFYKLPRMKGNSNAHIDNGTAFLYLDVNNKKWTLPEMGMETGDHAIFYTLQHYYQSDKSQTFSVMYNDEFPNSTTVSSTAGHTKGVSAFDLVSGYWLIHSIPKFPSNVTYEYPSNAHSYAQMGICITFPYATLNDIATQLFYNRPFKYEMNVPDKFATDFPMLTRVQNGEYQKKAPYTSTILMRSLGGQQFTSFAKCGAWDQDLYFDLVAPSLATSLEVETWQQDNAQNLHSYCTADNSTDVLDISSVSLPFGVKFITYYDHSKYAIAYNSKPGSTVTLPWVCVGDINRQQHQLVRGGGTMCIRDNDIWNVYSATVASVQPCNSTHDIPTLAPSELRPSRLF